MGIVSEANGGGYDVAALNSSGNPAGFYSRVFTWPAEATLTAGEMVWLWKAPGEEPVILVAGGGAGGCYSAVTGWGVMR